MILFFLQRKENGSTNHRFDKVEFDAIDSIQEPARSRSYVLSRILAKPEACPVKVSLKTSCIFRGKKENIISISNLIFFRFQDSGDSLGKLTPENKDKEILVPLTGSMYVPGQLSNAEKVLVDVGTGKKI